MMIVTYNSTFSNRIGTKNARVPSCFWLAWPFHPRFLGSLCGALGMAGVMLGALLQGLAGHAADAPGRKDMPPASLPARVMTPRSQTPRRARRPAGAAVVGGSYARFSTDMQNPASIADQQRVCREKAEANGHAIQAEFEFFDAAASGTRRDRDGLNAMLAAARQGRFDVIYFESLSRLARESVISLVLLKELVYIHGVRIISVTESIDSANGNWELLASFMSWHHEQFLKSLRAAVLRGQEGALLADFSVGDWPFGYASEPVPGSEGGRKGRSTNLRKRYKIDPVQADWVKQIFKWFVRERKSMQWIAREMTRRQIPKDHRSSRPGWHHAHVRGILTNKKYIGTWAWGTKTNQRNPLTGQVYQVERPVEEAAKWVRERPDLRIVDDELFFQAQGILADLEAKFAARRRENGCLDGTTVEVAAAHPRHLLQGLIRCVACGGTFQVSGAAGRYLGCRNYLMGRCDCRTRLPRKRAEELILGVISERILRQSAWRDAVLREAEVAWRRCQAEMPTGLRDAEQALAAVEQKIARLVDQIEDGQVDAAVRERLLQRRKEREQLQRQQDQLRQSVTKPSHPPTPGWVEERLQELHTVLTGGGSAAALALRDLVGGAILVEEVKPPDGRRSLRGTFTLDTTAIAAELLDTPTLPGPDAAPTAGEAVVLEFRQPLPHEAIADHVKSLFDSGVSYEEMAAQLGVHRNMVMRALSWWHEKRGLSAPDGRSCRKRLGKPTLPERLAEAAKELLDQGALIQDIARALGCNRDTVKRAIEHWFRLRGLPAPDGRTRRKELPRRSSPREPKKSQEEGKDGGDLT